MTLLKEEEQEYEKSSRVDPSSYLLCTSVAAGSTQTGTLRLRLR
jgi:hypothetical protein